MGLNFIKAFGFMGIPIFVSLAACNEVTFPASMGTAQPALLLQCQASCMLDELRCEETCASLQLVRRYVRPRLYNTKNVPLWR